MTPLRGASSWSEVGERVAEARAARSLTQEELAHKIGLERTAVSKIESGRRQVDAVELFQLAQVLGRPPEWFVSVPPPAVVSRRAERTEETAFPETDALLERLARDVELLVETGQIDPPSPPELERTPQDTGDAEAAADATRDRIRQPEGPIHHLQQACEDVGLYAYSLALDDTGIDGAYVALERGGVALINGDADPGRRRFNLAHELGHHVFQDEFSTDVSIGDSTSGREKLINAFAVHLLLPRSSIQREWTEHTASGHPREALIRIAAEYRVSWTAACAHLRNLDLIDEGERWFLASHPPTKADYLELGAFPVAELDPPSFPPGLGQAVVRAYKKHKIGGNRATELLLDTLTVDELPAVDEIPKEAFTSEIQSD